MECSVFTIFLKPICCYSLHDLPCKIRFRQTNTKECQNDLDEATLLSLQRFEQVFEKSLVIYNQVDSNSHKHSSIANDVIIEADFELLKV